MSATEDEIVAENTIDNRFKRPRMGRPKNLPKKRGPKPKNVPVDDLTVLENNMRRLLGMMETEDEWSSNMSPEQIANHKEFIEGQILHTSRLAILYITGCVSGAWHAESERSKMAIFIINQAVGTPTQKVAMIGESEEMKKYLDRLIELKDGPTTLEELKKEVPIGEAQAEQTEEPPSESELGQGVEPGTSDIQPMPSTD